MKLSNKLNFVLIFALIFSLIAPYLGSVAKAEYQTIGDKNNPTLTIHKYKEEETQKETGDPGNGSADQESTITNREPLKDVEFQITLTHQYNATTGEWEEVTGATPITKITDENGLAEFTTADGLVLGRYEVREISGPDDVILNPNAYFVDIPMTLDENGQQTLNYNVHIYPKNTIIRGDVELIKKDEIGNLLQGVQFGLFKVDGSPVVDTNNNPIVLTTNVDGKIGYENLPSGKYYFQEQSVGTNKVALNTTKIPFEVRKTVDGQGIEVVWTDTNISTGNVVTNFNIPKIEKDVQGTDRYEVDRDKEYTYNIKVTTPGDINNYKALGVKDILDDRLTYVENSWTVTGIDENLIDFNQNGQTLVWEISQANLQTLLPNVEYTISFKAKINKNAELQPSETGIPNDASLHFSNGKGTYTKPVDPSNPDPYDPYEPGDPDNPDPENPPKPEEPPTTPPVIVIPTEGGFTIVKKDKADDSLLAGAEFKLTTDEEGNNVVDATGTIIKVNGQAITGNLENLTTGSDGTIVIEGLTPGTYYLHETKAPTYVEDGVTKAYRLLTKAEKVEVLNGDLASKEVTVYNSKSGWVLPITGGIGTALFTLIGLALMAFAAISFTRRKKTA